MDAALVLLCFFCCLAELAEFDDAADCDVSDGGDGGGFSSRWYYGAVTLWVDAEMVFSEGVGGHADGVGGGFEPGRAGGVDFVGECLVLEDVGFGELIRY